MDSVNYKRETSYLDEHDNLHHNYREIRPTAGQRIESDSYQAHPRGHASPQPVSDTLSSERSRRVYDPVGGTWTRKPLGRQLHTPAPISARQEYRKVIDLSHSTLR